MHLGTLTCLGCGHTVSYAPELQPAGPISICAACQQPLRDQYHWDPWLPGAPRQITPEQLAVAYPLGHVAARCAVTGQDAKYQYGQFSLSLAAAMEHFVYVWAWNGSIVAGPDADLTDLLQQYRVQLCESVAKRDPDSWLYEYGRRILDRLDRGDTLSGIVRINLWERLAKCPPIEVAPSVNASEVMPAYRFSLAEPWHAGATFPCIVTSDTVIPVDPLGPYGFEAESLVQQPHTRTYDVLVGLVMADYGLTPEGIYQVTVERCMQSGAPSHIQNQMQEGLVLPRPNAIRRTVAGGWEWIEVESLQPGQPTKIHLQRIYEAMRYPGFWNGHRSAHSHPKRLSEDEYRHLAGKPSLAHQA